MLKGLARLAGALRKPESESAADVGPPPDHSFPRSIAPEQPLLWVGTAGFNPAQKAVLDQQLTSADPGAPRWETAPFAEADAWLVSGLKAKALPGRSLKVEPAVPHERSLQINLQDLDRPIACSLPVAAPATHAMATFELSPQGLEQTLAAFQAALSPLLAQYALGCLIAGQPRGVRTGVFHLTHRENLVATLDFQGQMAGLAPRAEPGEIYASTWERKPLSHSRPPPSFHEFAIGELTWLYVLRSKRELLPSRYRSRQIFFRHHPQVRPAWLRTTHRVLLQELTADAYTFEELRQRTALPPDKLAHALACLYYTGSITTSRGKAHAPGAPGSNASETQSPPSADLSNSLFFKN